MKMLKILARFIAYYIYLQKKGTQMLISYEEKRELASSLVTAVCKEDVEGIEKLLRKGADPFVRGSRIYGDSGKKRFRGPCAFHVAIEMENITILTKLIAARNPNAPWKDAYLISKGEVASLPALGKTVLKRFDATNSNPTFSTLEISLQGLEFLVRYGYQVTAKDVLHIVRKIYPARELSDTDRRILMLAVASLKFDPNNYYEHARQLSLCLGQTLGEDFYFAHEGQAPPCIEAAKILLEAGADPNMHCFSGDYDFVPALFMLADNPDEEEAVRLLLRYGADPNLSAYSTNEWGEVTNEVTIKEVAADGNDPARILELLSSPPHDKAQVNAKEYMALCRRELMSGYKPAVMRHAAPILVACIRATQRPLPHGIASDIVMSYVLIDPAAVW